MVSFFHSLTLADIFRKTAEIENLILMNDNLIYPIAIHTKPTKLEQFLSLLLIAFIFIPFSYGIFTKQGLYCLSLPLGFLGILTFNYFTDDKFTTLKIIQKNKFISFSENELKILENEEYILYDWNELENIELLVNELNDLLNEKLSAYSNEIIIIDNYSTDGTRDKIKEICSRNENVKGILNAKNFGQLNSPFYGMTQATGDTVILMVADFQDPPKMILDFIDEWEKGYKIVIGIKSKSKESKLMYFLRTLYYKMINKIANVDHIEHFTGFGLYDKDFINILRKLEDPSPYLRGIVAELGFTRKELNYEQPQRKFGKTKNNFYSLYDIGMLGITSYSKVILRISTFVGFIVGGLSFLLSVIYLILKLIFWYSFPVGTAPILIGIFFLGGLQLFFIGILGEYIMNINTKILKRPLVIEEERINFIEDRNLNNDK